MSRSGDLAFIRMPGMAADSLVGRTIGGYEVLGVIGAGGMGEAKPQRAAVASA